MKVSAAQEINTDLFFSSLNSASKNEMIWRWYWLLCGRHSQSTRVVKAPSASATPFIL